MGTTRIAVNLTVMVDGLKPGQTREDLRIYLANQASHWLAIVGYGDAEVRVNNTSYRAARFRQ